MEHTLFDLETELTKIRGHNLIHLFPQQPKSREKVARYLLEARYISSPSDPFVDLLFSLPSLMRDSERKFVVVANEPDVLCKECPVWRREKGRGCIGQHHYDADKHIAESYGLQLGKVYTANELVELCVRMK